METATMPSTRANPNFHTGHVECASLLAPSHRQLAGGAGMPTVSGRRPRPPARASSRGESGSKLPHSKQRDERRAIILNTSDVGIRFERYPLSLRERAGVRGDMVMIQARTKSPPSKGDLGGCHALHIPPALEGKSQCSPAALGWADALRSPLHRRGRLCHTSQRIIPGGRASTVPASKPSCEGGRAANMETTP